MSFWGYLKSKDGKRGLLRLLGVYVGVTILVMIFLWWYTDHGQQVSVPNLSGMTVEEATTALEDLNLEVLVIDSIYDKKAKPGTVLEQSPAPEQKVKEGRSVFLTIYRILPPQETINIKEGDFAQVAIIKLKNKGMTVRGSKKSRVVSTGKKPPQSGETKGKKTQETAFQKLLKK